MLMGVMVNDALPEMAKESAPGHGEAAGGGSRYHPGMAKVQ
jgi:hypothetical protein